MPSWPWIPSRQVSNASCNERDENKFAGWQIDLEMRWNGRGGLQWVYFVWRGRGACARRLPQAVRRLRPHRPGRKRSALASLRYLSRPPLLTTPGLVSTAREVLSPPAPFSTFPSLDDDSRQASQDLQKKVVPFCRLGLTAQSLRWVAGCFSGQAGQINTRLGPARRHWIPVITPYSTDAGHTCMDDRVGGNWAAGREAARSYPIMRSRFRRKACRAGLPRTSSPGFPKCISPRAAPGPWEHRRTTDGREAHRNPAGCGRWKHWPWAVGLEAMKGQSGNNGELAPHLGSLAERCAMARPPLAGVTGETQDPSIK